MNKSFIIEQKIQKIISLYSPKLDTDSTYIKRPIEIVSYPGKKNDTFQTNIKITGSSGLHIVCTHIVEDR